MRPPVPVLEFHISRAARERARFDDALFHTSGRVVLANPAAAHRLAARWTEVRGGAPVARAADLFALGLLDELTHVAIERYRSTLDPAAFSGALPWLAARLGALELDRALVTFVEQFPPMAVHRGGVDPMVWLAGATGTTPHRAVALEELLALWLTHANTAASPYRDLFESTALTHGTAFERLTILLRAWFDTRPRFGEEQRNLVDFLRQPALAAPDSLHAQLDWIRERWSWLVGDLIDRLLLAFDLRREEDAWFAAQAALHGGRGAGWGGLTGDSSAAAIPRYGSADAEYERFSHDAEWMPTTLLIAKSTYVWLDQLSRRYGRAITRLDHVPDEELDTLARFGINALWLIGLWERSHASREIKRRMGQPDAAASAYSLHDYAIAHDLGGEDAYRDLRDRAAHRGIRLASDMVPNHMGLDSSWLVEHPEWFLSLDHSPYPSYTFNSDDLSRDDRMVIQLEDHYYDRSDAAVVFRTIDRRTGQHRFVYHGNDGTSFPWNDTAQLDYLNPATREHVIQVILAVARRFPIIRFDAAMTLARRHIRRLWHPEPGAGGAIPSRAGHALTQEAFDRAMPHEFWREVVDRVAAEAPGTLLLAEAFWMMEGYFVRTLGMHRVYNSAFMNMLRDEENANYRSVIKNTLEFDPDVLQRYVNFLNNPDEKTAVEQFGRGEKYWGTCLVMCTLPGLPMFGHGQLEGFEEKYGMEFRRAQRDEPLDEGLWSEHWRRISPVLHRRWLFAGARGFLLYDCFQDGGHVNEDVYAYSNQSGDAAALVLFHNRHADAHGWIRTSAAYADKDAGRVMRQRTLAEGLALPAGDRLVRCREIVRGREHLFRTSALHEQGMRLELGSYESRVFVDWRIVEEDARPWRELERRLGAQGAEDLEAELWRLAIEPAQAAFRELVTLAATDAPGRAPLLADALATFTARAAALLSRPAPEPDAVREAARAALARLEALRRRMSRLKRGPLHTWLPGAEPAPMREAMLAVHVMLLVAGEHLGPQPAEAHAASALAALGLREVLAAGLGPLGRDPEEGWRAAARLGLLLAHPAAGATPSAWQALLDEPDARWLLGVHEAKSAEHFDRDAFLELAGWLELPALMRLVDERELGEAPSVTRALTPAAMLSRWGKLATKSKGRLDVLRGGPGA